MLPSCPGVIGIQTIAGAIATGTHGQGLHQGILSDTIYSLRIILANGSIKTVNRSDENFGAYIMNYGSLGVVTQVTFKTVEMEILTCVKFTTTFDVLLKGYQTLNEQSKYVKAWWFPENDEVHIWNVNLAGEREREDFIQNERRLTEIGLETDNKLNGIIDQMIQKMSIETCDQNLEGRHFETVQRFKSVKNCVGDIYQVFCKGIPAPQINCEIAVPISKMKLALKDLQQWFKTSKHVPHYPFILRCTGKSDAFLSGSFRGDVCWIGFLVYLGKDGKFIKGSLEMMEDLQGILAEHDGVPHFGKHFIKKKFKIENLPKWKEFVDLKNDLDPSGVFQNQFLEEFFSSSQDKTLLPSPLNN